MAAEEGRHDFWRDMWAAAVDMTEHGFQCLANMPKQVQLQKKLDASRKFAFDHPVLTMFMLVTVAMCSVPIMCFVAFACGSVFLTFTAFIFVEGFLLTVGGVLLGGVMCVVGFLALLLSTLLAAAWLSLGLSSRLLYAARNHLYDHVANKEKSDASHQSPHGFTASDAELLKDLTREKE